MPRFVRHVALAAFAAALLAPSTALAAPGQLDPSFGTAGVVVTDLGSANDTAQGVALAPDGTIVVAGLSTQGGHAVVAVARYRSDGSLDSSFGNGGVVLTDPAFASSARANRVAVLPDGRILVAGRAVVSGTSQFLLARYRPDGSLDPSFDGDGLVTTSFPGFSAALAQALVVLPDGSAVAGGFAQAGANGEFALARYRSDGSLDSGFDGDGRVTTAFPGSTTQEVEALALDASGRVVATGEDHTAAGLNYVFARYRTDGSLDPSFDSDGLASGPPGVPLGLALEPDGSPVAAGTSSGGIMGIARFTPGGAPDGSFGQGGAATIDFAPNQSAVADAVAIRPDGRIVVAGSANPPGGGSDQLIALAGLTPSGALDAGFGTSGRTLTHVATGLNSANSMALQADGAAVVAGRAPTAAGDTELMVARYLGDDAPPSASPSGSGGGALGAGGPPSPDGPTADVTPPALDGVAMTHQRFAVARAGGAAARTPRGTAFVYRLSEDASVRIAIAPARRGRRARARRGPPLALTAAGHAGANRTSFSGRIGRRALRPGRYAATLQATDAAGNRSVARTVRFVVVARR